MMRSLSESPGRKLIYFISDGFYLDPRKTGSTATERLRFVTDTAVRTGAVVYTIDARGLVSGQVDATNEKAFDPSGRLDRANVGEIAISQDGLTALAGDTGGRALRNTNYFDRWITKTLDEISNYYLLAWKPQGLEQKGGTYKRLEVSVVGRPDLTVRVAAGFMASPPKLAKESSTSSTPDKTASTEAGVASTPDADLRKAIGAFAPVRTLPVTLSCTFIDTPANGLLLTSSMQIPTAPLSFGSDRTAPAAVDIAGVVFDDKGKQAGSFKTTLNVKPVKAESAHADSTSVIYNYKSKLSPGLYQIRVAARDKQSGKVGSAMRWIEIPNLSDHRLTLSSLMIGESGAQAAGKTSEGTIESQTQFSVDRRFERQSKLDFLVFAYNASRGEANAAGPSVSAQVRILRGTQVVASTPQRPLKLNKDMDPSRIPYAGTIGMASMSPGRYTIEVTITDTIAKSSATRSVEFDLN
jgi:hypothetical protein